MIVDLSFPNGPSVNNAISETACSLCCASLDDVIHLIQLLGLRTQLLKMYLKDAYRIVPIHPHNLHLLTVLWQEEIYVDRALLSGLRSAPKIFMAVADVFTWALYCHGVRYHLHYLNDFLFVGEPNTAEASAADSIATSTFRDLGVPIATHKMEGPSTSKSHFWALSLTL